MRFWFKREFDTILVILISIIVGFYTRTLLISGDGVGYVKRVISQTWDIIPGHLLYVPMMEIIRRVLWREPSNVEVELLVNICVGISIIWMGIGVGAFYFWCKKYYGKIVALLLSVALFFSYGYFRAGRDVEAYSIVTAVLIIIGAILYSVDKITLKTVIILSILTSIAILFHTVVVLFSLFPPIFIILRFRKFGLALITLILTGILTLIPFAVVAFWVKSLTIAEAIRWLLSADNGYAVPIEWSVPYFINNILRAIKGLACSFIYSPVKFGYDLTVIFLTLGIIYLILLVVIYIAGKIKIKNEEMSRSPKLWYLWFWIFPFLCFGLVFWPSATERWIFILPCIWFALGNSIRTSSFLMLVSFPLVLFMILVNFWILRKERVKDIEVREKSSYISSFLKEGDMIVYPGHSWDEYIGFYEGKNVKRFILTSIAGELRGDKKTLLNRLEQEIRDVLSCGSRVILVRVLEPPVEPFGWDLMKIMKINRDEILTVIEKYNPYLAESGPVPIWVIDPMSNLSQK